MSIHTLNIANLKPNKNTLSDEQLIELIKNEAQSELFGIIYKRYSDKVYRKCMSFVKDADIANDMVQDVLIKAYSQLGKFKGNSRFSTWLYAITYNYCVEHYRKNSRYVKVDITEGAELPEFDNADEDARFETRKDCLNHSLNQISHEDKEILKMKYQQNSSIKELMDYLSISESAVKMRLARARKRLKAIMQETEKRTVVMS
ncbi:MAG: sigma-70 family RNA polymerase sigma factor [Bacteroidia bacterium]|nr:sigma-70 family RNA polymerase sigma factor [Bacteroidia bacterium]